MWSKTVNISEREKLEKDMSVDVAVIGAGISGILTAYFLQEAGYRTIVLEAARIGSGQTKDSTAKITSQHGLIYHRLIEEFGKDKATQYADANQKAIDDYRNLVKKLSIDCDFLDAPAYLYSTHSTDLIELECKAARDVGIQAEYLTETELPFEVKSALKFDNQAMFNPLKFLKAVADNVEVYENTPVIEVHGGEVKTEDHMVNAKHVVFACHYPFVNFPGFYFMRMHQERSYVVAYKNAANLKGMYYGVDSDGHSYRPYKEYTFIGGGNHRTGENSTGGQYDKLTQVAQKYWPQAELCDKWSAQDCMPLDGVPYIGKFCLTEPNWYVATGFQKWGITSSMVSARIITDLIVKGESENSEVFSPLRFTPAASAKAMLTEAMQSMKGLGREFMGLPRAAVEALPIGHGGVVEVEGKKYGVYKDENNEVFTVSTRCPHLGCQLEWNPDEKSWDCPCHGSRFDYRGNLIDNPAQTDIKV